MRRKVKIIATLGPASAPVLADVLAAGADVIRINASHTPHEAMREAVQQIRGLSRVLDRPIGILVDLAGPKVRTSKLAGGEPLELRPDEHITIDPALEVGKAARVGCTYEHLARDVSPGERILLDDGLLELEVVEIKGNTVGCRVIVGGPLGERKGINLPNTRLAIPALTPKDREDLRVAAELEVDQVALSFVQRPEDVAELRAALDEHGGQDIQIVSKIEKPQAVDSLAAIMKASDGVMVARGDLGVEMGSHRVPMIQKDICARGDREMVPVITATQMLDSMIRNPRPTRAEASDVANAIIDGTHAVMLSGETAMGQYPVEAVAMMDRIAGEVEGLHQKSRPLEVKVEDSAAASVARAACLIAQDPNYRAIIVLTGSGWTARAVSSHEPRADIIALTPRERTYQQLSLIRGVRPVRLDLDGTTDEILARGEALLVNKGLLNADDQAILVSGYLDSWGVTQLLKVFTVRRDARPTTDSEPRIVMTDVMPQLDDTDSPRS